IMGLSTAGVGLLPTYNDVGLWAPILLIMMRLIQGFSLGGENNGAAVYTIESFSKTYSGFLGGLILTGGAIGTVSAMAFAAFVLQDHNPEWWWRLPFLSGILISMIALYVRYRLNESPVFKEKVANKKPKGLPVAEVIRNHPVQLLQAIGMGGVNGAFGYNLVVYLAIYLEQVLGFDVSLSKQYPAIGLSLFAFLAPTAGYLSDKIGRDVFMKGACLFVFFGALPLYYMLNQEYTAISMIVAALMMAGFNGPTNAYLNELFPAHIRYTGAALGYAIGIGTIGGTMPLISSYFLAETGNVYVPAFYLMLMSVVGFAAVHKYKKA
ncbi:MAG: MFS transporter, partial [Alphaproteobacteria bacterium]